MSTLSSRRRHGRPRIADTRPARHTFAIRSVRAMTDRRESRMSPIVSSIEIARPPAEVYTYATDPSNFAEWQRDVVGVRLEGPPLRVGTTFTTTRRIGGSQ